MQGQQKMASVEDYAYDQSMFKFSNTPTGGVGLGFSTTNQLEYFNLGGSQLLEASLYPMNDMRDSLTTTNGPLVTPGLNQTQPQNFFQNFLDIDQQQYQSQQQQQPGFIDPFSSDSNSSLTPFDQSSSRGIPSSVTTSITTTSSQFPTNGLMSEESVFPSVDTFLPSSIDTQQQQHHIYNPHHQTQHQPINKIHQQHIQESLQQQQQHFQRSRYLSEPNIMAAASNESSYSLSPHSVTFGANLEHSSATNAASFYDPGINTVKPLYQRYRVIRGISSGGSATKPPKVMTTINHHYVPVKLDILDAGLNDLCLPKWNENEKFDKRRIMRVERYQIGSKIVAKFSIVGAAEDHPTPEEAQPGVDVVEVSCLECFVKTTEDTDAEDENGLPVDEFTFDGQQSNNFNDETKRSFYITSVEVIKIVELLIGTEVQDPAERRRERGRIRSNLVPFWSKRPISSRMSNSNNNDRSNSSSPNGSFSGLDSSSDFRIELATRIMGYDVRKPRGFDKEVRILKWEKLVPALRRALQSYYVEIPDGQEDY